MKLRRGSFGTSMTGNRFTRKQGRKILVCSLVAGVTSALGQQEELQISPQELAERALTRVSEQINSAIKRGDGTTWASQPGAISLFYENGKPSSIYKLYSAPAMVASRPIDLATDLPADWDTLPENYVDLNRPEQRQDGIHFPIADPRADAEGFSYEAAVSGVVVGKGDDARLPMPVSWLYVLADGNEGYLDRRNRFVGRVTPTRENPIVGRYGFWTDDNTSRINVNTASEGVYWDTPRVNTEEDRAYGRFQPAQGEYQRYPGHPARVSMSSVLFPGNRYHLPGTTSQLGALSLDETKTIWEAARGISSGGSTGGTTVIDTEISTSIGPPPDAIVPYRDPSEMKSNLPEQAARRLEQGRFFLTTENRSSDINLMGFPRLTTWPTPGSVSGSTPFDRAIAAVSTIARQPYLIQRQDAYSRHWEFYINANGRNERIFNYLQKVTLGRVAGFGGSFSEKYGAGRFDDRDQILTQSLGYLRGINLNDGTNRVGQYTRGAGVSSVVGHGQVTPFCLCGGSADHTRRWFNPRLQPSLGPGRMFGLSEIAVMLVLRAETSTEDGNGSVTYLGEKEDLEEFGLWQPGKSQPEPARKLVQLGIIVEGFAPAHGLTYLQPMAGISVGSGIGNDDNGLPESFSLNGQPLTRGRAGDSEYPWATKSNGRTSNHWIGWGGYGGVRLFEKMITFEPVVIDSDADGIQFGGASNDDPLRILLYDSQFDFRQIVVSTGSLFQSYRLSFPSVKLPIPEWWSDPENDNSTEWYSFEDRMKAARSSGTEYLFSPEKDVIQSLVPRHGDYRLINGRRVNGPETFVPHPEYGKSRMAHSLVDSRGPLPGATFGRELIPGAGYAAAVIPDFPISPESEEFVAAPDAWDRGPVDPALTGDWDSGVGPAADGAYNNKADDGDLRGLEAEGNPYFDNLTDRLVVQGHANFVPHRMALPGMMGSLSTGMRSDIPWQTLLFRPDTSGTHYGASGLPDHLWLDLFRMPVVGPGQNSDAFSTDGKVNLNYRIVPFTYITRATALHAAMKSEKILAIPTNAGGTYKTEVTSAAWRHHIDAEETLKQWEQKFDAGELFRTESEICEQYLVPEGVVYSDENMKQFWNEHRLTGDNVKERPYADLHAMVTTKSNSYEVHVIAQTIAKSPDSLPDVFDPELDTIVSEWRGVGAVQSHLDPEDDRLPDYVQFISRDVDLGGTAQDLHQIIASLRPQGDDAPFEITDTVFDWENRNITLTWNSNPGEFYTIETTDNLAEGMWKQIDRPATQRNNIYYRGLRATGYETEFTMPVTSSIKAIRVSKR